MFALRALGRRAAASCCWRATASARSRSTTPTSADALLFGSELKALLAHPRCPRELDFDALSRYLALEYVPTPRSIFEGVRKLPGGHLLRWRDGTVLGRALLGPRLRATGAPARTDDDYVEEFRELLRAAVRRRLVSDVPLGAFLSGGIDSSSVVAMMAEALPAGARQDVHDRLRRPSFDESEHARRVAAHFGTDHHEEVFTAATSCSTSLPDCRRRPRRAVRRRLDPPDVPPLAVHARVGHGGARRRRRRRAARRLPDLPGRPRRAALPRAAGAPRARRGPARRPPPGLDQRTSASTSSSSASSAGRGAPPETASRDAGSARSRPPSRPRCSAARRPTPFEEQRRAFATLRRRETGSSGSIYLYAKTYLQDDILVKVDRASMATARSRCGRRSSTSSSSSSSGACRRGSSCGGSRRSTSSSARWRTCFPPGSPTRPKKGFGIPVAEWFKARAARAAAGRALARADPPPGDLRPADVQTPGLGAPDRTPRPPEAALDAVRVPALASTLDRAARLVSCRPFQGSRAGGQ